MYTRYETEAGSIIWRNESNDVVMWRGISGLWYHDSQLYQFDKWLELADLPHEEKVWLRLHFG